MRKLKIVLAVFITLLLIAAGACIQFLVSKILDDRMENEAEYDRVSTVELSISQNTPGVEKLAMMAMMTSTFEVSGSELNLTYNDVGSIVDNALLPYENRGMILKSEDVTSHIWGDSTPMLVLIPSAPELQDAVWLLERNYRNSPYLWDEDAATLDLVLDDEMGSILKMEYTSADPVFNEAVFENHLLFIARSYFIELGITDYMDFRTNEIVDSTGRALCRYTFEAYGYGTVYVDIVIHEYGFYIDHYIR